MMDVAKAKKQSSICYEIFTWWKTLYSRKTLHSMRKAKAKSNDVMSTSDLTLCIETPKFFQNSGEEVQHFFWQFSALSEKLSFKKAMRRRINKIENTPTPATDNKPVLDSSEYP
uniref:Uncharacterized protein n=1 Tax=Romanomermis culicivorax TaxID=13658 RepID=A0A915L0G6_ROMCU